MRGILSHLAAVILLGSALDAGASVVYEVDMSVGKSRVFGSIETDGTLGSLGIDNIVATDLYLNDGTDVVPLSLARATLAQSENSPLSASASALYIDFTGHEQPIRFRTSASGQRSMILRPLWVADARELRVGAQPGHNASATHPQSDASFAFGRPAAVAEAPETAGLPEQVAVADQPAAPPNTPTSEPPLDTANESTDEWPTGKPQTSPVPSLVEDATITETIEIGQITESPQVPETGTLLLIGIGLIGMALAQRARGA